MLKEKKSVDIFALDHQGRGIGRIDDKITFIPNVLEGENADINIVLEKKNFSVGELIRINKISDKRITPICPHFYTCGGCDLMHMSYDEEMIYKEKKVKDIMKKFADVDNDVIKNIVKNDKRHNYRNKVTFKVDNEIGFYEKNTHEITKIDYCYIIDDKINELLRFINTHLSVEGISEIIVKKTNSNSDMMLIIETNNEVDESKIKKLMAFATSIYLKSNGTYKHIAGSEYITEKLGDFSFLISPDSFFQVNTKQALNMYNKVIELAKVKKSDIVLELYSGTGTISTFIAKHAKKVYSIEINKQAVNDAIKNAEINNVENIEFVLEDAEKYVQKFENKVDILVVDPPRSGLDKNIVEKITKLLPEKIVYISCDPVTLARDIKLLKDSYEVKEIIPYDMFPNTYHVECVSLLDLKKS